MLKRFGLGKDVEERAMKIRVVFDGPPSHEAGRFVEVEDENGASVNAGFWRKRDDGLWELCIHRVDPGSAIVGALAVGSLLGFGFAMACGLVW